MILGLDKKVKIIAKITTKRDERSSVCTKTATQFARSAKKKKLNLPSSTVGYDVNRFKD